MTTRVMERGRIKCGQYWETEEGGVTEYDNFRIRTTRVETNENYTVVSLELTNIKVKKTTNKYFFHNFQLTRVIFFVTNFRLKKPETYHIGSLPAGRIMVCHHRQWQ